uniref:Reverse transcriptase domain-containing protein n=1 Tax=Octopus bimaculoides TaxID=37653 RepID=A0A0L8FFF8_OCTBM
MDKAFDRVPQSLIWWSMRKIGIEEWLVRAVRAMYRDTVSKAITQEFKTGCPWELLYADDLALIAESLSELEKKKGVGRNSIRCTQCKL